MTMCNACGNVCCGSDQFEKCGCDGCDCEDCWSDEPEDMEDDDYHDFEDDAPKPNNVPPDLQAVLAEALAKQQS
jgi:hypothetical protein